MVNTIIRPGFGTLLLIASLALPACSKTPPAENISAEFQPINILMFGDSGYHLDYPDQDDYVDLFTAE